MFAGAWGVGVQEPGRPMAAKVRNDHALTRRDQAGDDVDVAVDVVGIAMEQQRHLAVERTGFKVGDVERTGVSVPERFEPLQGAAPAARSCIQARRSGGSSPAVRAIGSKSRSPSSARATSALVTPWVGRLVTAM